MNFFQRHGAELYTSIGVLFAGFSILALYLEGPQTGLGVALLVAAFVFFLAGNIAADVRLARREKRRW